MSRAGAARQAPLRCVCVLERRGRFLLARELFPGRDENGYRRRPYAFALPRTATAAGPGEIVALAVNRRGLPKVVARLGRTDRLEGLIEGLLVARGARLPFGEAVQREVGRQARRALRGRSRKDLRDLPTFTIDPADAKDHDDAVSARRQRDGTVRVWVHIADVAAFVPAGGAVDREALDRATSIYLPGTVEPMLPPALAADLCSLRAGVERLAVTVELVVGAGGVREAAFYRSVIRSNARLSYEQVDRHFAGRERIGDGLGEHLEAARVAAAMLLEARRRRGALELESFEPEVKVGRGRVEVRLRRSGGGGGEVDARALIEQLMVAANEAVAGRLIAAGVPALYRVHPRPDPQRVDLLADQLHALDLPTPPLPKRMGGEEAARAVAALAEAAGRQLRALERRGAAAGLRLAVSSLILRSLQQAYYSAENLGHAALASPAYCHFTSPIRRYPDLVVHRALLSTLGQGKPPRASTLPDIGRWTSDREREAQELEREGAAVARAFALAELIREEGPLGPLEGQVIGISEGALYLAFGLDREQLPPFEGVLPLRALRHRRGERGRFAVDPLQTAVHDRDGRLLARLGQSMAVEVARVEPERGSVLLWPAQQRGGR